MTPHGSPAEWTLLLATPAAPMLQPHPAPASKGEPSRQHLRVSFAPEVSVNVISSNSESEAEETPAGLSECQCGHCLHE